MKKSIFTLLAIVLALFASASQAQVSKIQTLVWNKKVIDPGFVLGNEKVTSETRLEAGWFGVNYRQQTAASLPYEIDLEASWDHTYSAWTFSPFLGYFALLGLEEDDKYKDGREVGLTVSYAFTPEGISLGLYGGKIWGEETGKGGFLKLFLTDKYSFLQKRLSCGWKALLVYNHEYFTSMRVFSHTQAIVNLDYRLWSKVSAGGIVGQQFGLHDQFEEHFFFNINLGYSF